MENEQLQSTGSALEHYAQICIDYCDKAENILREQEDPSPIADMARQVIYYGQHLGQFEHMLSKAYMVTNRMAECLSDHPRLLLELLNVEYDILQYIEALEQHDLQITEDLRMHIKALEHNIKAADAGQWKKINDGRILHYDPIEWTKEYEELIDEADHEAYSHLTDIPRGMGFCFAYWEEKRKALAKRGIEWKSPNQMNPGVMFD
ncbi:MAG: hypothetical protein IJ834_05220 [Paludibacteraceae bacterium]|nr:hypothetical protein [Paludibacteraceae bacterium]